jgi:pimeloyl-ACP methyl ester carboxylesterase
MKWPTDLELVLLPGLDGTGHLFKPLLQAMPNDVKVSIISYPSNKRLSYQQLVDYATEQLPKNKPLLMLAESFSGPIAVDLLSSIYHNIRGAIFCASFVQVPRPLLLRLAQMLPLATILDLPMPTPVIRFFCLGQDAPQSIITLFQEVLDEVQPSILAHRLKMLANLNVVSALANLKMPCCYLQATNDKLIPHVSIKPFQDALPNLLIKRVAGPHFILQAKPVACIQVIKDFSNLITVRCQGADKLALADTRDSDFWWHSSHF